MLTPRRFLTSHHRQDTAQQQTETQPEFYGKEACLLSSELQLQVPKHIKMKEVPLGSLVRDTPPLHPALSLLHLNKTSQELTDLPRALVFAAVTQETPLNLVWRQQRL